MPFSKLAQHLFKGEEGNISMSSEVQVRATPRPAKTPAWSVPPLMTSMEDPSSGSDNASDHSDKIESLCSAAHHNGNNTTPPSHSKNGRKRKMNNNTFHTGNGTENHNHSHSPPRDHSHATSTTSAGGHGSGSGSLWMDAESLAADFEGSLSGLGGEGLSSASYDMSEALLALPAIYQQHHRSNGGIGGQQPNIFKEAGLTPLSAAHLHGGSSVSLPGDFHFEPHSTSPCHSTSASGQSGLDCERRFQYVLAAATSAATKINEETLTYLNQGQPYEVKLKKLGELTAYRGMVFRSIVRLCFHDRRLQFSEKEQISAWEEAHRSDRILQVDLPLSYGVTMIANSAELSTNTVSFLWEPLKEVGLYIKVNCISTEFTPKKHGGEKGVPFRIMIETYSHPENVRLHAGACQLKVFKLKGADRKHKQDREKIMKKTPAEQAKLQPSYDCTVLSDVSLESLDAPSPALQSNSGLQGSAVLSPGYSPEHGAGGESPDNPGGTSNGLHDHHPQSNHMAPTNYANYFSAQFSPESVRRWLVRNRFGSTKTLWDFSGTDLLRLTKEEFVEMCGLAEGIRLYNALHFKITFYITFPNLHDCNGESRRDEPSSLFHPLCLSSPSLGELASGLCTLFQANGYGDLPVERVFLIVTPPNPAPSKIRVLMTEQLLTTLRDQSAFRAIKHGHEISLEVVE